MPSDPPTASLRGRLNPDVIHAAAVTVADADGLAAVTMRRVANELGVEAMSLYNHVDGKAALHAGMLDHVLAQVALARTQGAWRRELRNRATALRQAFLDHPWALPILGAEVALGPARQEHDEALQACLASAGFSDVAAAQGAATIDAFVYGFALHASGSSDEEDAFSFGLELVLDGLARAR